MQQTPEIKTKVAEFADLMKEVSNYTGNNIKTTFNLFFVYNTLVAETYYGLRLPQWTQGIFPNGKLLDATLFQFDLFSYGKLKSKNGGVLLRKVINDMDGVINGTLKDRKINLFSGHDINMAALLYALNIFDYQTPKFSSSVIIELHEKDGQFFVKVLHYLGVPPKMVEKIIPGCEILCPYDKFVLLTSESTATDEEMECPEKMILRFDF
ncbi:venom acid phosphatase acph-1-like protein [Lasius niger]|uniref:acid phosphatase n=1 Tax=Lasius niger TaxID=67767 RepID=A0A0J7K317_LASNI|nr:venom acid phosphatase acph-1-like protein [Lasius niger]